MRRRFHPALAVLLVCWVTVAEAQQAPLAQSWDYAAAMRSVAARFDALPGVVLHVGDSITYSNPYGQWARYGKGKTAQDVAVLKWMHCGADDASDGSWLCRFDHPRGGRSHTACSGIRADEMLAGGKRGMPPLGEILKTYRPQVVVLMLGTNDVSANRPLADYAADIRRTVDLILGGDAICILSTIPPHPRRPELARRYNTALRQIAQRSRLPLVDYEREILRRRPDDFNGSLLVRNDPHPTAAVGEINAASAPTRENLQSSGYLLRGWLSVQKIAEVKRLVLDPPPDRPASPPR